MTHAASPDKRTILYVISAASFLAPMTQSIYAPSIVAVRHSFDTTYLQSLATISVFSFVLGISQLFYGPLVDTFSCRRVLLVGLAVYAAASLLAYFAPTIVILLILRALQGFGIATASVVAGSLIADLFPSRERASAMAFFQMSVATGLILGPVVGSAIAAVFDWRASFLFLVAAAATIAVVTYRSLPAVTSPGQPFSPTNALRVARNPAVMGTAMLAFMQYYGLSNLINLFAILLAQQGFALAPGWAGPLLVPLSLSLAASSPIGGRYADRHGRRRAIWLGSAAAGLFSGVLALLVALPASPMLIAPIVATLAALGLSLGFNWPGQLSLVVEWFPKLRASAVGVYNFTRFLGSSLGSLVGGYLTDHYGISYAFATVFVLMLVGTILAHTLVAEPAVGRTAIDSAAPRGA